MSTEFIKQYDNEENLSLERRGIFITEAFSYAFFNRRGRQTSINRLFEISKYIDTMQENRCEENIQKGLINKITQHENDKFNKYVKKIYEISKELENSIFAINSVSRSLAQYRILKSLISKGIIFEIGPGSGHLGSFIMQEDEYKYIGYENTQAFYITQNFLWNKIFPGEVNEVFDTFELEKHNHLPWWKFSDLDFELPTMDCVIANHVFSEMHPWAYKFTIKRIKSCLKENGYVICEGLGNSDYLSHDKIINEFYNNGFSLINTSNLKNISNYPHIYIFKKIPNVNNYSINTHMYLNEVFLKHKNGFLSFFRNSNFFLVLSIIKKALSRPPRFRKIKPNIKSSEYKEFNYNDILNYLKTIDENQMLSDNDKFLKYIDS